PCRPVARLCITLPSDRRVQKNLTTTQSMEQCKAAIKAMKVADDRRAWSDISPHVDNIQCVEVKGA
ncbi:hypothetical protein ACUTGI_27435, partial [Klebsiella pneumoniae]